MRFHGRTSGLLSGGLLAALLPMLAVSACRSAPREAPPTAVTGRVFLPRDASVPAGAVLELRVLDVTPLKRTELSTLRLPGPTTSPVEFALPFDWAEVDPAHSYALRARVVREGGRGREDEVLFTTPADTAVLTRGNPRKQDLRLVEAESAQRAP